MPMSFCVSTPLKKASILCVFLICFIVHSANARSLESLTIKAGEVYQIPSSHEFLTVATLRIGDNAKIELPQGMPAWSLQANEAYIGKNVAIIGSGSARKGHASEVSSAKSVAASVGSAQSCNTPKNGGKGLDGKSGFSGTDINLRLGLASFESLYVDTTGGDGEDGSPGENGQDADQSEGCRLISGGNAGAGGDAGHGGNSGHVSIVYTAGTDQSLLQRARSQTQVIQAAGKAGTPGKAGKAGKGSSGTYIMKKTLTGNKKWVSGGDEGKSASDGAVARIGAKGRMDIQVLLTASPKSDQKVIGNSEAKSLQRQLEELRNQYQALLKRVERLEN